MVGVAQEEEVRITSDAFAGMLSSTSSGLLAEICIALEFCLSLGK